MGSSGTPWEDWHEYVSLQEYWGDEGEAVLCLDGNFTLSQLKILVDYLEGN